MPFYIFWEAYFDLTKLDPNNNNDTKDKFLIYAISYADDNCNDFLQTAVQACHNNSKENIKKVMELVTSTTSINSDSKLAFFSDLVDTASDDGTAPSSSTSSSTRHVDTIISCAVDCIEKHEDHIIHLRCTETLLRKFSSFCNDVQSLRKIFNIQSDMLRYREFTVSSVDELSWKLIRMVTSPSTSYDTIRYFTEHTGKELHPCITAEIVMKWWRVRESVCPDDTFIITLLSKI